MGLQFHPNFPGRGLALAAALLLHGASAQAMTGDTLQPFMFYRATQDNNLFRTSSNEQTDLYQQLGAGLLLDWNQSRQEVTGKISANKTAFSKNSALDFSGYDFLGQWNWQSGNYLSGQLGFSKTRSLSSFQDNNIGQAQNTVDQDSKFFQLSYLLHPEWRVNASVSRDTVSYSSAALQTSDHTQDHVEVSGQYLTHKGSTVSAFVGKWKGDYPNPQFVLFNPVICFFVPSACLVDNSFTQTQAGLRASWVVDGKVQLNGEFGQTKRVHKELSQRDFSGLTGKLDANWQATGKLQVAGSIYRQLSAVDVTYATYAVTDGIRLTPSLQITPKVKISAEAYYENLNFKGDPFALTGNGPRRKDKTSGGSLSLTYQPDTWALFTLSYQAGNRDTNNHIIANDFSYQMLSLLVLLQF